ncbi:MAG TPA: CPBP family intramembrane glutamic endopeptidase [Tepidisphaeraceae bacterium]|jgi:membrane protease YdiL (CAAX protease family)
MSRIAAQPRAHSPSTPRPLPAGYLARAELPLASLVALLPLIILYEVGTRAFAFDPAHQTEQRIIAFTLMQRFFALFGATGQYLPAMAVVCILLTWHIARNDPWTVSPSTLFGMILEGAAWGVPLLAIGTLTAHYLSHYHLPLASCLLPLASSPSHTPTSLLVLSLGAGIYEELVFRLIGLTLLHVVFCDILRFQKLWAYLYMVVISAVAFSLYHYLGYETFSWRSFAFRTLAGVYFAILFVSRGFGITALSHASYDVIVVALRFATAV